MITPASFNAENNPVTHEVFNLSMKHTVITAKPCVTASEAKQSNVIAKPLGLKQSPRRFAPRDNAGFTLLELLIGIVLFGVLSIGYYRDQRIETDISWAGVQAQRYQQVSTALGRFMSDNYSSIKALPHNCSTVVYAANQPKPTVDVSTCSLTTSATSSVVSNGMQPLVSELIESGYLSNTFEASFVWPGLGLVYQSYAGSFDPSKTDYPLAPFTYASLIQAMCNSKPVSDANTCTTPELRSLVFNSQPFAENPNYFGMRRTERLSWMRESLGSKALMSYDDAMQTEGQLYGLGNKFFLDNPLVRHDNSASSGSTFKGVAAIFALQNNYKKPEASK
jgi:prepilin-type N-terminal cleavage/methylation domain-containing protein